LQWTKPPSTSAAGLNEHANLDGKDPESFPSKETNAAKPMPPMPKLPASVSLHARRRPRALSPSAEDCLERIAELITAKGYARVVDIAAALRVQQPSVTAMVQHLSQRGFLHYERYRGLTLTPKGAAAAKRQLHRRAVLIQFLSLLGLDAATVARDVESMEHHLSDAALGKLELLIVTWRPLQAGKLCEQDHSHPMAG
jgi:Mn-dependent DtxR family transcriptional regulator